MLSWVIFAHATDNHEEKNFIVQTKKIINNDCNTRVWIFYIYSHKIGKLYLIESGKMDLVFNLNKGKMEYCSPLYLFKIQEYYKNLKFFNKKNIEKICFVITFKKIKITKVYCPTLRLILPYLPYS